MSKRTNTTINIKSLVINVGGQARGAESLLFPMTGLLAGVIGRNADDAPKDSDRAEAPSPAENPVAPNVTVSKYDAVVEYLSDPRYTLRTVSSIYDKFGLSSEDLYDLFEDRLVYRTRRSDGAALVGLASRN